MSDKLQNFNNPYANLSQGAYPDAPITFSLGDLPYDKRNLINSGKSAPIDFSQDTPYDGRVIPGGQQLPNNGIVYLQPDPTLRSVPIRTSITTPNPNGGYTTTNPITSTTKKGLLTDEPSGFNTYFL